MKTIYQFFILSLAFISPQMIFADGGVVFQDIAAGGGAGFDYERVPSVRFALLDDVIAQSPIPIPLFFSQVRPLETPQKGRGAPGVAIFDYDLDGDLDIYATNGSGANNSLYANQLAESGQLTFIDLGEAAGVGAVDQDSSGVCFGDIDNDGDPDLYVLGTGEANRLFENQGDGTFLDITGSSNTAGEGRHAVGCSFADFNGDGLLDVVVGNSYDDWNHRVPVFTSGITYGGMEHTYLFVNQGGNAFTDESASSGLENVSNMSGPGLTGAAYTWALAAVDHDLDGDVDILFADNQGAANIDAGLLRLYDNDGTGSFTEITAQAGLTTTGGWMGLDFGDFNCDGELDFFATDLGYVGAAPSRWFLRNSDGTYTDSGAGGLMMTPFGWGASVFDYDNDADADIVYHGGVDLTSFLVQDNPGVILQNPGSCTADFLWDDAALITDHRGRSVQGVAVGDLNEDGFEDIVSISNFDQQTSGSSVSATAITGSTGSPFDAVSILELVWVGNVVPGSAVYLGDNGRELVNGTLSVEISSGDNGNGWVEINTVGSAGILHNGTINRDGIGAVVFFEPMNGKTSIRPIIGGSSYASQDSLAANFGLGAAPSGTVDVLWPGGVRNRLYQVTTGERVTMPHIPCSYDGAWKNFGKYNACVMKALNRYKKAGVLTSAERNRLRYSARRAFFEHR